MYSDNNYEMVCVKMIEFCESNLDRNVTIDNTEDNSKIIDESLFDKETLLNVDNIIII